MSKTATGAETLAAEEIRALLSWYRRHARDLPWRRTSDPYRILVSEVMLQQTRAEVVADRYLRFLARFSTLAALAAADEQEVLAEWSGLGYYRRARNLHRLARAVLARHDGRLPADVAALRALPGIGEYTAAAVASIAFGLPELCIDGNVARVLCRRFGIGEDPARATVRSRLRAALREGLRRYPPGTVNEALMELGAGPCRPVSPACHDCPLRTSCVAAREDTTDRIPRRRRQRLERVEEAAAVFRRGDRVLLMRGHRPGTLEQMWEFPTLDSRRRDADTPLEQALARALRGWGLAVAALEPLGAIRHGITTRSILCRVFLAREVDGGQTASVVVAGAGTVRGQPPPPECRWVALDAMQQLPLGASAVKIRRLLTGRGAAGAG